MSLLTNVCLLVVFDVLCQLEVACYDRHLRMRNYMEIKCQLQRTVMGFYRLYIIDGLVTEGVQSQLCKGQV